MPPLKFGALGACLFLFACSSKAPAEGPGEPTPDAAPPTADAAAPAPDLALAPDLGAALAPDLALDLGADLAADLAPPVDTAPLAPDVAAGPCTPRQCGVQVACGQVDDGCGHTVSCPACNGMTNALGLRGEHLAYDPARKRLYATVAGAAPNYANSVVFIDPAIYTIVGSLPVGSNPGVLALSEDRSTLWMGIDGSFSIRRADLTASPPALGPATALPKIHLQDPGTMRAGQIVALPGSPRSVAVSMHYYDSSPSFAGVVVLDDGVPRRQSIDDFDGSAAQLTGGPPGFLFGYNNQSTGFQFWVLRVADTGVTQTEHTGLVAGFDNDIVYADSRVYAHGGEVIDVSSPAQPQRAGKFGFAGVVLPQANRRILMLTPATYPSTNAATLRLLDGNTFTQITSVTITGVAEEHLWDLVQVGDDTVAFLAGPRFSPFTSRLVFVRNALIKAP